MADISIHQSLSQQQTLAPQMRKSLEILQASTLELTQLVQQALETNPVLEDLTEVISLDEEGPDPEEAARRFLSLQKLSAQSPRAITPAAAVAAATIVAVAGSSA